MNVNATLFSVTYFACALIVVIPSMTFGMEYYYAQTAAFAFLFFCMADFYTLMVEHENAWDVGAVPWEELGRDSGSSSSKYAA